MYNYLSRRFRPMEQQIVSAVFGVFEKLKKTNISFSTFLRTLRRNNAAPTVRILVNFYSGVGWV
jgi:hypothetical protein